MQQLQAFAGELRGLIGNAGEVSAGMAETSNEAEIDRIDRAAIRRRRPGQMTANANIKYEIETRRTEVAQAAGIMELVSRPPGLTLAGFCLPESHAR